MLALAALWVSAKALGSLFDKLPKAPSKQGLVGLAEFPSEQGLTVSPQDLGRIDEAGGDAMG